LVLTNPSTLVLYRTKELPQDIDLLLIMAHDFNLEIVETDVREIFDIIYQRWTTTAKS
jgi:hypothetical protein